MPIHFAPISRRDFLRRALVAGAGVALTPQVFAATSRRTDANSWALLADSHIAANPARVNRTVNLTDHFVRVSRELLALPQRPAGMFVVGDLAFSDGQPGDYTQITSLLDPLRSDQMAVHLALGNHDQRENFRSALAVRDETPRPVTDKHAALLPTERLNWLMLDSLEKTLQTPGALGAEQLQWLTQTLDANPTKPAAIVVHHNPGLEGNFGLKDTTTLLDVIRPRRQVKAWIYGHTHQWKVTRDESGIHLINLPPVAYVFRDTEPSGWVHATVQPDGMRLELRSLNPQHQAHGQVVDLKWRAA